MTRAKTRETQLASNRVHDADRMAGQRMRLAGERGQLGERSRNEWRRLRTSRCVLTPVAANRRQPESSRIARALPLQLLPMSASPLAATRRRPTRAPDSLPTLDRPRRGPGPLRRRRSAHPRRHLDPERRGGLCPAPDELRRRGARGPRCGRPDPLDAPAQPTPDPLPAAGLPLRWRGGRDPSADGRGRARSHRAVRRRDTPRAARRAARAHRSPGTRSQRAAGLGRRPPARRSARSTRHHRSQPSDSRRLRPRRTRSALDRDRSRPRRDGHGQGADRAAHPRPRPSPRPRVRRRQLRRLSRDAARERAVRAQEGVFHRRGARQGRSLRARPPRHALPRRDRRDQPGPPGQAAPRAPGAGGPPGRRHTTAPDRRPRYRRDQPVTPD